MQIAAPTHARTRWHARWHASARIRFSCRAIIRIKKSPGCDLVHKLIEESSRKHPFSRTPRSDGYERSRGIWQSSDFDAGLRGGACLVRAGLSEDGAPSSAWQRLAMQPDGSSDKLYSQARARAN